jgi:hypothetical protein
LPISPSHLVPITDNCSGKQTEVCRQLFIPLLLHDFRTDETAQW